MMHCMRPDNAELLGEVKAHAVSENLSWQICSDDRLHAGLVETSSNLASVKPEESEGGAPTAYKVNCSTRSSLLPALEQVRDSIARLSRLVRGHIPLRAWKLALLQCWHRQRAYERQCDQRI